MSTEPQAALMMALDEIIKTAQHQIATASATKALLQEIPSLGDATGIAGLKILAGATYAKTPDGKLTPYGVEVLYRMFDAGMNRYQASSAMNISFRAGALRFALWKELGGNSRQRPVI